MKELWDAFGHTLTSILPRSPFASFIQSMDDMPFLGWLNWVIPMREIVTIFGAWLGAVALFYLVQVILRWVKVIQG